MYCRKNWLPNREQRGKWFLKNKIFPLFIFSPLDSRSIGTARVKLSTFNLFRHFNIIRRNFFNRAHARVNIHKHRVLNSLSHLNVSMQAVYRATRYWTPKRLFFIDEEALANENFRFLNPVNDWYKMIKKNTDKSPGISFPSYGMVNFFVPHSITRGYFRK